MAEDILIPLGGMVLSGWIIYTIIAGIQNWHQRTSRAASAGYHAADRDRRRPSRGRVAVVLAAAVFAVEEDLKVASTIAASTTTLR